MLFIIGADRIPGNWFRPSPKGRNGRKGVRSYNVVRPVGPCWPSRLIGSRWGPVFTALSGSDRRRGFLELDGVNLSGAAIWALLQDNRFLFSGARAGTNRNWAKKQANRLLRAWHYVMKLKRNHPDIRGHGLTTQTRFVGRPTLSHRGPPCANKCGPGVKRCRKRFWVGFRCAFRRTAATTSRYRP